jgi:hypothetical protein
MDGRVATGGSWNCMKLRFSKSPRLRVLTPGEVFGLAEQTNGGRRRF